MSSLIPAISSGKNANPPHDEKAASPVASEETTPPPPSTSKASSLSSPKTPIPENLKPFLPPKVDFFIGRKPELETLQKTLSISGAVILVPKEEIPCKIGKSLIARHYASRQACVYWIAAKNKETLETSYQRLAQQLKLEPSLVKDFLSQQEGLVIFDGVRDSEALQSYLPHGKCHVLITSRKRDWNLPKIEVGAFSPEDGADFLCQATGKQDRETAKKISETLDSLPTSLSEAVKILGSEELKAYFNLRNQQLEQHAQKLKTNSNLGSRNSNFTGREMSLVALEETLKSGSRAVITGKRKVAAEIGLGGVGKTQIALQYAFRNADKYPFFVWWINCESEVTRHTSYAALAARLGILLDDEEKKVEHALIKKVNARLERESGWLLICDNVEAQKSLEGLIPKAGGHVLITSRNPDWNTGFARVFPVGLFTREESIALIQKMTSLTTEEAGQLADLVGNLPIAVAQAAAYIERTSTPFKEYEQLFKDKSQELFPNQRPTDDYSKTVNITWALSMRKIKEIEKKEADALYAPVIVESLMNLCAFLDSKNIPRSSLLLAWVRQTFGREEASLEDLNRALRLLRAFSMIDLEEENVSVHLLVQCVTRDQLEDPKRKETCGNAVRFLSKQFKFDIFTEKNEKIENDFKLLAHIDRSVEHAWRLAVEEKLALSLKHDVGNYQQYNGLYSSAASSFDECLQKSLAWKDAPIEMAARNALARSKKELGEFQESERQYNAALAIATVHFPEDFHLLVVLKHSLSDVLLNLGRDKDAKKLLDEAIELFTQHDSAAHPIVIDPIVLAGLYNSFGNTFRALGNFAKARDYYEESLKLLDGSNKDQNPILNVRIADIGNNLAATLEDLGEFRRAEENYRKTLQVFSGIYPKGHPFVGCIRHNLARLLNTLGRYPESIAELEVALELKRKGYGPDHLNLATSLCMLAKNLRAIGKYEEALSKLASAIDIYKAKLPADHTAFLEAQVDLADTLVGLNKEQEAVGIFRSVLPRLPALYAEDHPYIGEVKSRYGDCLMRLKRYREAKAEYREVFRIWEKVPNNPHLADAHNNFGVILMQENNLAQAIEQYRLALSIAEKRYPPYHLINEQVNSNLGRVYLKLNQPRETKKCFTKALAVLEHNYPADHVSIGDMKNDLGLVLRSLEEFPDAKIQLERALQIREICYPANHPFIADTRLNLGAVLIELGKYTETKEQFEKALQIYQKAYPPDHHSIADTRTNLAVICEQLKLYAQAKEHLEKALEIYRKTYPVNHPIIRTRKELLTKILLTIELQKSLAHLNTK